MRTIRPLTLATLALVLLLSGAARADHVVLLDGRKRTGKVVSEDRRFVVLETKFGRIRIARVDIDTVFKDDDPEPAPAGTDEKPVPDAPPSGTTPPPRRIQPDPAPADTETKEPEPEKPAETTEDPEPDGGETDESGTSSDSAQDGADAAQRQENRRRSRAIRRVTARSDLPEPASAGGDGPGEEIAFAGQDLASVAPGTPIIVFESPREFGDGTGAIEVGRRWLATLEMAGVRTAWLRTGEGETAERRGVKLSQVQRHVEIKNELDRKHLFEGLDDGAWVRLHLDDGSTRQGRFEGASSDRVFLTLVNDDGSTDQSPVYVQHIREVDGLLRSTDVTLAIRSLMHHEPISITMWPDGERILGQFVHEEFSRTIGLDTDADGEIDLRVPARAAIAEVHRIPTTFRETATELRPGDVVRVRQSESFDDALVRRASVARVAAVTSYALALHAEDGADVIPWGSVRRLVTVVENPETALSKARERLDPARLETGAPVLPGASADDLEELAADGGVSTIDDGRNVTHVFFAPPYDGAVFGVRLGEKAAEAIKQSPLVFDTVVVPRGGGGTASRANELHSDTVSGVHVTLLVGDTGRISAIELSQGE